MGVAFMASLREIQAALRDRSLMQSATPPTASMSCGSDRPADPSLVRFRALPPARPRFWRKGASRTNSWCGSRCEPQQATSILVMRAVNL